MRMLAILITAQFCKTGNARVGFESTNVVKNESPVADDVSDAYC